MELNKGAVGIFVILCVLGGATGFYLATSGSSQPVVDAAPLTWLLILRSQRLNSSSHLWSRLEFQLQRTSRYRKAGGSSCSRAGPSGATSRSRGNQRLRPSPPRDRLRIPSAALPGA